MIYSLQCNDVCETKRLSIIDGNTDYILKCAFFIAIKNHFKVISALTNVDFYTTFLGSIQLTIGLTIQ